MASSNYFCGVNLRAVKEQIIFSIVVEFESLLQINFTEDMKLIVRQMKRNGIYNFLNINPQHLYKEVVIAFYQEATVTEHGIESSIFGENICITCQTVADAFNDKNSLIQPPSTTTTIGHHRLRPSPPPATTTTGHRQPPAPAAAASGHRQPAPPPATTATGNNRLSATGHHLSATGHHRHG
ncbi:hypothetical protein OROMI_003929 [Orobanche minor]